MMKTTRKKRVLAKISSRHGVRCGSHLRMKVHGVGLVMHRV